MMCYLDGVDFKKLKLEIDDEIESPTERYARFVETNDVVKSGMLESPYADILVDAMDNNMKEELKQRWREVNEFARWQQEMKMKQEAEALAKQDMGMK